MIDLSSTDVSPITGGSPSSFNYTGLLTDNIESQEGPTGVLSWSEMDKNLAIEKVTDEINFYYKDELERAINVYGQTDLEKYL